MDIKCPHCGTEYEIDKAVFGQFVKCEVCGNGFVAGASSSRASGSGKGETTSTQISTQRNVQSESVKCPHCGVMYEVSKSKAGKLLKCRKCGQLFVCAFVKNGAQSTNSSRGQTPVRSNPSRNVVHEPVKKNKSVTNVIYLSIVSVIGVVVVAVAVFFSLQALSDNKCVTTHNKCVTTQDLDGVVIEKLGGERFRKEYMCGRELYFAALPPSRGFAPNVNVFMDKCTSGWLPSLSEYVNKGFKDYEAMGCNVSILERDYNYVTMAASGNGLTFDIKIIRDERKDRFVVVTGTMRSETAVMGARKSDKEAESIVHKIIRCVHSARL